MVGWNRRFHPIILEAKRQVAARGPVTQIVGEFHKSITRLAQSGKFPEQPDGQYVSGDTDPRA